MRLIFVTTFLVSSLASSFISDYSLQSECRRYFYVTDLYYKGQERWNSFKENREFSLSDPELMEKLWAIRDEDPDLYAEWERKILHELQHGQVIKRVSIKTLNASAHGFILTYKSGLKGIFKFSTMPFYDNYANPASEVAAYLVDKELGLNIVPITTYRRELLIRGSVQIFVDIKPYYYDLDRARYVNRYNYKKIQLLDFLIMNWDRGHNTFHGRLTLRPLALDHGIAFQEYEAEDFRGALQVLRENVDLYAVREIVRRADIESLRKILSPHLKRKNLESFIKHIEELKIKLESDAS